MCNIIKKPASRKKILDSGFLFLKFMQQFIPWRKRIETCRLNFYSTGRLLHVDENQVK